MKMDESWISNLVSLTKTHFWLTITHAVPRLYVVAMHQNDSIYYNIITPMIS
jgi:hypothetical protein